MTRTEKLLNSFATRSFRDIADCDYIAARMAYRADLIHQFLWSSQQAIEKYLKGILLLNRIPATDIGHDLEKALSRIQGSGKLTLDLTEPTIEFVQHIDTYGRFRYLEVSPYWHGYDIVRLDQAIWEIRRYCTTSLDGRKVALRDGESAPIVNIPGGYLEKVIANREHSARKPLLWQNAYFGTRRARFVSVRGGFAFTNSSLHLNPELVDELEGLIYLPREIKKAYRERAKQELANAKSAPTT